VNIPPLSKSSYTHPEDAPDYQEPTQEERKESLRKSLNISSWDNTFANFKAVKGTEIALATFKELASGKASWNMLLCYGSVGCGKTHLCEAFSIEFALRNIRVLEWSEVVRGFKKDMHSEYKDAYDNSFERFRRLPQLIIDDIGSGSTGSNWEWGELEDIVNYRYRESLLTVMTTNLDIKDLPDRIVSRFRDAVKGRIVLITAPDYRPKKC